VKTLGALILGNSNCVGCCSIFAPVDRLMWVRKRGSSYGEVFRFRRGDIHLEGSELYDAAGKNRVSDISGRKNSASLSGDD
jgi:hypothetical protein